jgi:hypothetical protein
LAERQRTQGRTAVWSSDRTWQLARSDCHGVGVRFRLTGPPHADHVFGGAQYPKRSELARYVVQWVGRPEAYAMVAEMAENHPAWFTPEQRRSAWPPSVQPSR